MLSGYVSGNVRGGVKLISIVQNEDVYELRFRYDPELISLIKEVPGRRWNPDMKFWSIPKDKLGFFYNQILGTRYEKDVKIQSLEELNVNKKVGFTTKADIPNVDISDIKLHVAKGSKIFEHQKDTLRFYIYRRQRGIGTGFMLCDQPGTGKSLSVTNIALYKRDYLRQSKHCLIIACVNSAKYNWVDDIEKHTNGKEHPYILGSRLRRNGTVKYNAGGQAKVDDLINGYMYGKEEYGPLPYFLVVNIEAFRTKTGRAYTFTEQVLKWCDEGKIDLIVLDEIHKNASPQSQQGKQILNIKKKCPRTVEWIPMTGTPITKKPTDVFLPLRLVDGHNTSSFYMWCQDFCVYGGFGGHEIIAYKNVSRLKNLLEPNMLRRRKEDILDLPRKVRMIEYVENTPTQEKLYREICNDMIEHRESIVSSLNPLSQFLRLRQVNGSPEVVDSSIQVDDKYLTKNAKMKRVMEIVDDIIEQGEKVLIFSNWVEPLRTLYGVISKKYGTCCYVGTMKPDIREQHKRVFMTNPKYPVMVGTIGAMGTSHTLTAARNIIFLDQPWNPSDQEQCEDRCHRPGQSQSLNIYTLITKGTIDERVNAILSKKEGIANYIVDSNLDLRSHPELFDILLGIEKK